MKKPYRFLLVSALVFMSTMIVSAQENEAGLAAANRGDFETAIAIWFPLTKAEDPRAQFEIGYSYDFGGGLAVDDVKAVRFYTMAAEQGQTPACKAIIRSVREPWVRCPVR